MGRAHSNLGSFNLKVALTRLQDLELSLAESPLRCPWKYVDSTISLLVCNLMYGATVMKLFES
jgi:hypothetical protein